MKKNWWFILLLLYFMGCEEENIPEKSSKPPKREQRFLAMGEKVYLRFCSPCHGEKGNGQGIFYSTDFPRRPSDFTSSLPNQEKYAEWIIGENRRQPLCPPMKYTLSSEEIMALTLVLQNFYKIQSPVANQK